MTIEPASDELIAEIEASAAEGAQVLLRPATLSLISRIRKEQEDKAAMAEALKPFSAMAGILFSRNFNAPDLVMGMTTDDGSDIELSAGDFFEARRALSSTPSIIDELRAENERLREERDAARDASGIHYRTANQMQAENEKLEKKLNVSGWLP